MDTSIRFVIGTLILLIIQVTLGSTLMFLIRRRKRVEPMWSWPRTVGAYSVLVLIVTAVSLVPIVGRFAAVIVTLIGLKRMSGLDLVSTFILAFLIGLLLFAISAVVSMQLQVDLLVLEE